MKDLINELNRQSGKASVTITAKTHRTRPDFQKDPIRIKNLIKEAEQRLSEEYSAEIVKERIEQLNKLSSTIDHSQNREGLILVVNDKISRYYQLPVEVESRVVINHHFATRDLVRASREQASYYILVLSRRQARLIAATNNHPDFEFTEDFPIINDIIEDDTHKLTMAQGTDLLIEGFFKKVDKALQRVMNNKPAPVILATEERNYNHFTKVAERPIVVGHLNQNRDHEETDQLVRESWPLVKDHLNKMNKQRLEELQEAINQQRFLIDLSDIWRAVNEGRGRTVFVKRGFHQPAQIENGSVIPMDLPNGSNVVDDIVDEIIEVNLQNGGDAVFLSDNELNDFKGLALTTRY